MGGRDAVSPAKQLLVFLWHISNLESVSETSNLFGISPSTAQGCVHSVAKIWLHTPFRDNGHLTAQQRRYNRAISGVRQTVERAIGHLKGRFRRLTALHCTDVEKNCHLVMAACVLHNLCILTDDDILIFINMEEAEDANQYHNIFRNAVMGEQKRNQLLNLF
ncbi:hypothetical protein ACJMK2_003628 [Sinanodonta woodiana]|uniref:DDE Tnp4 domain-containing protein n=1 Tax=Sinanodonta woodiana TaxID=1069815 RepID=A0ABD3XYU8_SINWO